ncbi:MAG: cbb3-type cytochrome c oxidase subunit 3 [Geminicoccaceae bacterium]|nr:MAG: cbb3-type cytochrome c oxidase subunit 3 [Geminicoccaceae bacterium]
MRWSPICRCWAGWSTLRPSSRPTCGNAEERDPVSQEVLDVLFQIWLVGMVIIFLGIVWWAFKPSNRKKWEERGRLPFDDKDG